VFGLDGVHAGTIVDVWVDRSEYMVRYLEVALSHPTGAAHVLFPIHYTEIDRKAQRIGTSFITGAQFADVPATRAPDSVTLLEEDKITAYYAGGMMYAVPGRGDPII
jgi:photosynthetic reaction center H subunit